METSINIMDAAIAVARAQKDPDAKRVAIMRVMKLYQEANQ